jgi:hypothetical protein
MAEINEDDAISREYVDKIKKLNIDLNEIKTNYKKENVEGREKVMANFSNKGEEWPRYNGTDFYPDDEAIKYIDKSEQKEIINTALLIKRFTNPPNIEEDKETIKVALSSIKNFKNTLTTLLSNGYHDIAYGGGRYKKKRRVKRKTKRSNKRSKRRSRRRSKRRN